MGMVYFKSNSGSIVTMDGETSIDVSKSNTVANSSVISTKQAADDLIEGNLIISVQGMVTWTKTPTQLGNPTPEEWVDLIEETIASKQRFTLYSVKYFGGQPLLKDYPNLVIKDYGYTVDKFSSTITARIVFNEIFVSDPATTTFLAPVKSAETKKNYQDPTKDGKGTSTQVTEEDKTIIISILDYASDLFGGSE